MKCPVCGNEMREGGIIANMLPVYWVDRETFDKNPISRKMLTTGIKAIGKSSVMFSETKIPNAYYCETCSTVTGSFEVTN